MFNFGTTIPSTKTPVVEDLFDSADEFERTLVQEDKPAEKVRIRAYSDDYYKWIGKAAPTTKTRSAAITAIIDEAKGTQCKRCSGTGIFKFDSGKQGTCHQCAGSGTVTAVDAARTAKYWKRLESGASMDKHYSQYML